MNFKKFFGFSKKDNTSMSKKTAPGFYEKLVQIKNVEGLYSLVNVLPNPDPVLRKTGKGFDTLRQLENEGQIATCIESRKSGVLSLNLKLKYDDEKYKGFYEDLFKTIDINEVIGDILNAPLYGFQPVEIIWAKSGKYVIPDEITAPPQEWFFFNPDNQLCFKKKGLNNGLILPPEERKFLCPKHKATFKNPYGLSLLCRCFWDSVFKRGGYEMWARFMERYSMPYLIGKYEKGANEEVRKKLLDDLSGMIQDAVAVIPSDSSVEIKDATGRTGSVAIYKDFVKICDENIAKNILGQTLTTQSGGSGSYALGNVHAAVRKDIICSDKRLVEKTINQLLLWIQEINFGNQDAPSLVLYEDEEINLNLAQRDKVMSDFGVKFTPSYIQRAYNLKEEDFTLVENNVDNVNANDFADIRIKSEKPNKKAEDELDLLAKEAFEASQIKIDKNLRQVIEHFSETKDAQKALEELAEFYPKMDFGELEESLARVIFISDLWGRSISRSEPKGLR